MKVKMQPITFAKLDQSGQIPYELLLLADPSKALIDNYLKQSEIFVAKQTNEIIGVIVLFPLSAS